MASVYKRTWTGADDRERIRWVAAYKDQNGRRHNKGFLQRKDAKAFLVQTEGEIARARPCGNIAIISTITSCR